MLQINGNLIGAMPHRHEPKPMPGTLVIRKRILLVHDQEEVRETIKMLLDVDEHIITEASSGKEAIDLFSQGQFDLVMTDYAMAGMRGDELAARLKQMAPSQPILMVTGSVQERAAGFQVNALLGKPFLLNDLRQALSCVLSQVPTCPPKEGDKIVSTSFSTC